MIEHATQQENVMNTPALSSTHALSEAGHDHAFEASRCRDHLKNEAQPLVTVDVVMLSLHQGDLQVLLMKRKSWPYADMWAIPGGFVTQEEALEEAARRTLFEKTGLHQVYLEQLATFGAPERDPRARVITVAYFALLGCADARLLQVQAADHTTDVAWFSLFRLPPLAFDHAPILDYTLQRLRGKLEYTTIAFHLLPEQFTLSQLQQVYERILRRPLDKRNFRKKILSASIIEDTRKDMRGNARHRPARLYRFSPFAEQGSAHL
jgi:8-oxo-dGTP diphosphatase